ncbi:MAG: hypothetical protein US60_C0024G0006 [Microgenomates group bacterium GW2011_GWC1_37_8]|nr:MAG: hypothetical protein US60_C0024G0006 [Microgenomates group bacterium GW2011_GWC1_37_8]
MGIIEDNIFANYRKALEAGSLDQAKKAVDLARTLKEKIEQEGFLDYSYEDQINNYIPRKFFEPFPYRYYPKEGVVVVMNFAINLTAGENKLFNLLSSNESYAEKITIVNMENIKMYLWGNESISKNAVRIAIKRLRLKIEPDIKSPQMLISVYNKGYIFLGKRVFDEE